MMKEVAAKRNVSHVRRLTQEELLEEAKETEKLNLKSLGKLKYRVHTGPGNREKVGDFEQAFSRPGIAGKFGILRDWSGNRREF